MAVTVEVETASPRVEVAVETNADIESDLKKERHNLVDDLEACGLNTHTEPPKSGICYRRPVLIVLICIALAIALAVVVALVV